MLRTRWFLPCPKDSVDLGSGVDTHPTEVEQAPPPLRSSEGQVPEPDQGSSDPGATNRLGGDGDSHRARANEKLADLIHRRDPRVVHDSMHPPVMNGLPDRPGSSHVGNRVNLQAHFILEETGTSGSRAGMVKSCQ
jgi:hypothetical protein